MDSIYEHEAEGAVERTRISDTRKSSVKFDLSYGDDANNSSMVHANKNQSNCLFKQSADSHKVVGSEKGKEKPILRVVSACPICGSDKPVHTCHVDDAVQAPVQSCKSSLDESALNSRSADDTELQAGEEPKSFVVIHLGCAVVDRRFPPKSIMPWVMAEVKRSRDTFKEVSLQVLSHTIKAISYEDSVSKSVCTVFEHKLHGLSRFAKTHQDPRCFGYLRRESLYSDFECHVFLANDEKVVCEIAGNEIADKLAKEAAEEAENMPEVDTPLTSIDVKRAVRDSCKIKWQNRWEASQRGRHMFEFHPSVVARKMAFGSIPAQRIVTQLRTGYCYLNGYLHAVGLKESPLCTCGEPESVKHFIEDCEQYEEIREKLRSRLFFGTGNSEFSCKLFLEVKVEDEFQECRQIINEIFEEYIFSTKRFKTQ